MLILASSLSEYNCYSYAVLKNSLYIWHRQLYRLRYVRHVYSRGISLSVDCLSFATAVYPSSGHQDSLPCRTLPVQRRLPHSHQLSDTQIRLNPYFHRYLHRISRIPFPLFLFRNALSRTQESSPRLSRSRMFWHFLIP